MNASIDIHPSTSEGRDFISSLPYEAHRGALDCGHSLVYIIQPEASGALLCGLCFFKDGYQAELPPKFHVYKQLAENGNPETTPRFMSHLNVVMGLIAPKQDEDLHEFRRNRNSLAREQYTVRSPLPGHPLQTLTREQKKTKPSWGMYPVASSLWKLMGYQPPLGVVLVRAIGGRTETEIAYELNLSLFNVHERMGKAIRTALTYLPKGEV